MVTGVLSGYGCGNRRSPEHRPHNGQLRTLSGQPGQPAGYYRAGLEIFDLGGFEWVIDPERAFS